MKRDDRDDDRETTPGLIGAAVRAPLSQGREGSFPVELDGHDLTEPPGGDEEVRGAPTEPEVHAPTTRDVDPRPVATGERTVEKVKG